MKEKPVINYDYFELYAVAYFLKYPANIAQMPLNYIYREDMYSVLSTISDTNNLFSISRSVLCSLMDDGILPNTLDKIYQQINELNNRNDIDNEKEMQNILSHLKQRKTRDDAIMQVEESLRLLKQGKINDGINKIKDIQFSKPDDLLNTTTLMIQSLIETNGFRTGIKVIDDEIGGFLSGNLTTIVGDTGGMKTMVSLWLCLKILLTNPDFTCLYFEKEMPVKDVARRLLAYATGIETDTLLKASISLDIEQTNIIGQTLQESYKANPKLENILNRLKIVPQTNFHNVADIYQYVSHYKPNIWCLDFLTQITDSSNTKDENYTLQVKNAVDRLKYIVSETNSFGIILSQIGKNTATQRAYKVPRLGDIEWSGTIQQYSTDIFACFYPKNYYGEDVDNTYFYLISLKGRNGNVIVPLKANPKLCTFEDNLDSIVKSNMENWLKGNKGGKI
jgi:replicative DNA helicase